MFSSQSPYIEPGLTLCFCSREIKQPSIYAVYCPGFSMGTFLTGISFNGHYLYLVRAGLFCVSPEIIRLSTGSGRRYACFRAGRWLSDNKFHINRFLFFFFLPCYWLPCTEVVKNSYSVGRQSSVVYTECVMTKEQVIIVDSSLRSDCWQKWFKM